MKKRDNDFSVKSLDQVKAEKQEREIRFGELYSLIDTSWDYVIIETDEGDRTSGRIVGYDEEHFILEDLEIPTRRTFVAKNFYTGFKRINRNGNPVEEV